MKECLDFVLVFKKLKSTISQGNSLSFLKVLDIHQNQVRVVCFYVYINVCTISRHRNGVKAVKIDDNQKRARQC